MEGVSRNDKYLSSSELLPLSDAHRSLEVMRKELSSNSWKEQFAALDSLRRLCVHHPTIVSPCIPSIATALRPSLHSLRSSLARNALLAVNELLKNCGSSVDKASLRILTPALMRRSCETNEFLADEATKALHSLAEAVPVKTAVPAFLDHAAKSPNERAETLLSLEACVNSATRKGTPVHVSVGSQHYVRLVKLVATRLEEGSINVRSAAKRLSAALELQSGQTFWKTASSCLSSRTIEMMRGAIAKEALAVTSFNRLSTSHRDRRRGVRSAYNHSAAGSDASSSASVTGSSGNMPNHGNHTGVLEGRSSFARSAGGPAKSLGSSPRSATMGNSSSHYNHTQFHHGRYSPSTHLIHSKSFQLSCITM